MQSSLKYFFLTLLFLTILTIHKPCCLHADDISYTVEFIGVEDKDILSTLESVSELFILQESPPATATALRRRAEADIPNLIQGLHSFGYYNAKIELDIDTDCSPANILIEVNLGQVYPLAAFQVVPWSKEKEELGECQEPSSFPYEILTLKRLGLKIGQPALPKTIVDAENKVLQIMAKSGYPLAKIENREVVADQTCKTIDVTIYVNSGPLVFFGETTIGGLCDVNEIAIQKKIRWHEGQQYDPILVEQTLDDIESSGLFSAVTIENSDTTSADNQLPIDIALIEAKHRTIGGGIGYNTQLGPGFVGTWENRNIRGLGEKLKIHTDIAQYRQIGTILYAQPDFLSPKQDLLWITELESEKTKGFSDTAFSFSGIVDREISNRAKFSYGGTIMQLHTEHSNNNRQFVLLKSPLIFRWSTANSLLDPTRGRSLNIRIVPTVQIMNPKVAYCINTITGIIYKPLTEDNRLILAGKASFGSMWGASDIRIPPPERFYIGSESTLRGYNYLTVSPLGPNNKPIGGRSMMVYTAEMRYRINEEFGAVAFYEIGNAYLNVFPRFNHKQLQSVGGGLRYHTPVGPLRFDVAFPLNRRAGIDRAFQFYFSIGQSF